MAATESPPFAGDQHIIERPRLTRMLDESKAKVILLLAPAGYGKTTLARQWLKDKPHVWYRATEADADVAALALGLATAAARSFPGVDRRIRERVRAVRDPEREAGMLAEIVGEDICAVMNGTWLAIDDYQHVSASPASELFVQLLLESLESRVCTTSRARPSWATARSIIYGGTSVITHDTLAMTDEEVTLVTRTSAETAPALFREAMGWPAVVGLAAHLDQRRISADELPADLYDYFAEELWQELSERERAQLAQLALVGPMPLAVAEDLIGDSLEHLLSVLSDRAWANREGQDIVIHPLLRRFLLARFARGSVTDRKSSVRHVIDALVRRGAWDQAMTLALASDPDSAPRLLELALDGLLDAGRLPTLERWVQGARDAGVAAPILDLASAEIAFRKRDYARSDALATTAAAAFISPELRARGLNRAGKSAEMLDRTERAFELHSKARENARGPQLREAIVGLISTSLDLGLDCQSLLAELPSDGSATDRIRSAGTRLQTALRVGGIQVALDEATPLLPVLQDVRDPLLRTSFMFTRAGALVSTASYREGLRAFSALEDEAATFRIDLAFEPSRVLRSLAEAGLRNFERARALIAESIGLFSQKAELYGLANAYAIQARIDLSAGLKGVPPVRREFARVGTAGLYHEYLSSIALAEACHGDPDRADSLSREAREGYMNAETEVLCAWVDAIVQHRTTQTPRFDQAFLVSLERGFLDDFVTAYRGYPTILDSLMETPDVRRHVEDILVRANDLELAQRYTGVERFPPTSNYRLTRRELEVYRLMVEGCSNKMIAARLVVTESTAKLHVRHILEKLCARSRAEAVAKWRDVLGD